MLLRLSACTSVAAGEGAFGLSSNYYGTDRRARGQATMTLVAVMLGRRGWDSSRLDGGRCLLLAALLSNGPRGAGPLDGDGEA